MIRNQGFIAANYGADDQYVWVSPKDIAAAIAEEIVTPLVGSKVRYVASEELTGNETAVVLGASIGNPDLKWIIIPSEQMQSGLEAAGMNPNIAAGLVEMYAGVHSGIFLEDYFRNRPSVLGKVKMTDFAREFATAFNVNNHLGTIAFGGRDGSGMYHSSGFGTNPPLVNDGQWHCLVGTAGNNTWSVYVELRICNRVLTGCEIDSVCASKSITSLSELPSQMDFRVYSNPHPGTCTIVQPHDLQRRFLRRCRKDFKHELVCDGIAQHLQPETGTWEGS